MAHFAFSVLMATKAQASAEMPSIALYLNSNNVAGAPWRSSGQSENVKYLGLFNTTEECQWACLSGPPPAGAHCCSFTFHTPQYEPNEPHGWWVHFVQICMHLISVLQPHQQGPTVLRGQQWALGARDSSKHNVWSGAVAH